MAEWLAQHDGRHRNPRFMRPVHSSCSLSGLQPAAHGGLVIQVLYTESSL
jgi:hypothetical protein